MDVSHLDEQVERFLFSLEKPSKFELEADLHKRLEDTGMLYALDKAEEIVVCGSRALGCHREDSDLDVIIVPKARDKTWVKSDAAIVAVFTDHGQKIALAGPNLDNVLIVEFVALNELPG